MIMLADAGACSALRLAALSKQPASEQEALACRISAEPPLPDPPRAISSSQRVPARSRQLLWRPLAPARQSKVASASALGLAQRDRPCDQLAPAPGVTQTPADEDRSSYPRRQ